VAAVSLPPGPIAASAAPAAGSTPVNLPGNLVSGVTTDEPLPIEQAFIPNPRFDSANELTLAWQIEPGYYLYRDRFTFTVDAGDIRFSNAALPAGVLQDDLEFGEVEVYFDDIDIIVPFTRPYPDEQTVTFTAGYQGCKEDSICYPPSQQSFTMTLPAATEFPAGTSATAPPLRVSDQDRYAALLTDGSWFALLGSFYLGGLLLSFTPCVLPMVPILSGIIAGQGARFSPGRGFALSAYYVLVMALTYSAEGILAALAGSHVQAVFQKTWIIASFS
jgi:thiol:disulfide interchange protein DsbD